MKVNGKRRRPVTLKPLPVATVRAFGKWVTVYYDRLTNLHRADVLGVRFAHPVLDEVEAWATERLRETTHLAWHRVIHVEAARHVEEGAREGATVTLRCRRHQLAVGADGTLFSAPWDATGDREGAAEKLPIAPVDPRCVPPFDDGRAGWHLAYSDERWERLGERIARLSALGADIEAEVYGLARDPISTETRARERAPGAG